MCASAEAIGMTAAAAAAKSSQALVGEPSNGSEASIALALVVAGGLVEGVALGGLQAAGLQRALPALDRRRWLLVTMAVAGVGWAVASAPAALSGGGDGPEPALLLVLGGALGLGVAMGALLGAAQAMALRGHVRHPWRWVAANAAAWGLAMMVIFLGATAPGADWPGPTVAVLGTVTGLAAGTVLGVVSGWFLPTLDGPPAHNRVVLRLLGSRAHRALDRSLVALRVRGALTGRTFELPVQYAHADDGIVVVAGRPETKRWWRNLVEPAPVDVLLRGHWQSGEGLLLRPGDPGHDTAIDAYRQRWPRVRLIDDSLLVQVRLGAGSEEPEQASRQADADVVSEPATSAAQARIESKSR
jgi:hypothetical protein